MQDDASFPDGLRSEAGLPFDESIFVSPPFSCAAGLVVDILLRLDIAVRPPSGEHWTRHADGYRLNPLRKAQYLRHADCLASRDVFQFADRKSVVFEHRMDIAALPAQARILLVRDPVDAVYSWHRRFKLAEKGLTFEKYLNNYSIFPAHLPHGSVIARPLDVYAIFVLFWMLVANDGENGDLVIVRYEDLKQDPVQEVSRILAALGADRSGTDIADAAHRSSFDVIRSQAEDRPVWSDTNLRSKVYEWRERMSVSERAALTQTGPIAAVCRMLSYETGAGDVRDVFQHDSAFWAMFSTLIRKLRLQFPSGYAAPRDFFAACGEFASSISGRLRSTACNDISFDADDVDGFTAIVTAIHVLREIFLAASPQPVCVLERLVTGLSAVIANSANTGALRLLDGKVRVSHPSFQ
jgi:hypothetical protein